MKNEIPASFEKLNRCCNPLGIHTDSKTTGLRNVSETAVVNFTKYYNGVGMTTNMKICSTCRRDYFSSEALAKISPVQSSQPIASSSHQEQEEFPCVHPSTTTPSTVTTTSSSLSQSSVDSVVQPALLSTMPSYEREFVVEHRLSKLTDIAKILDVTLPPIHQLKPTSPGFRSKADESIRNAIIDAINKLFPSEPVTNNDQTTIVNNIKDIASDEGISTEEKYRLINLLPSEWSHEKVAASLGVTMYAVSEARKPASESCNKRLRGNQPLSDDTKKR